jgi:hypothetical protein
MRGRIRQLKPEVFLDEEFWSHIAAHPDLHLWQAFEGLWCVSDREGRFEWRPAMLKTQILPYWDGDFERSLEVLHAAGYVRRYEVEGRAYGEVRSFERHQRPNSREPASVIPSRLGQLAQAALAHAQAASAAPSSPLEHVEAESASVSDPACACVSPARVPTPTPIPTPYSQPLRSGSGSRVASPTPAPVESGCATSDATPLHGEPPPQPPELPQPRSPPSEPGDGSPSPRIKFRADWKPTRDAREYGRQLGLTDDEMRDRAEHCRLKLYTHAFSTEDEQFRRELLWLRNDKETQRLREQRKANPNGLDENPGTHRRSDDPHSKPFFGRTSTG